MLRLFVMLAVLATVGCGQNNETTFPKTKAKTIDVNSIKSSTPISPNSENE